MDLPNIRAFLSVVREGGFSAAARALHLSQPSVSARLRRLEETTGEPLFEREGREVRLTAAGSHLLPIAEDLVRSADDFARAAKDFRSLKGGRLDIGTTDVASIYVLPRAYRRFVRLYPAVDLSVAVEGSVPLLEALRAGRIELAVANLPVEGDDLAVDAVDRDDLLPVLPTRHPLAARKRVRLEDLASIPMITFKPSSVTRREVARAFASHGLAPRIAMEISSPEAIKKLVEVGLGFAVLPARSVRAELREGRLSSPALAGLRLERRTGLIRLRSRYLSPAAQAFASLVKEGVRRER
ncbi:MAG: LysR family transcriptional regulator [Candidatus Eisenbacteria bacterium]